MIASPSARPSTRSQLMAAGRGIVLKDGFHGLTIRAVAAAAGANLGSFVYHFGTRETFVEQLIEEWYAPLLSRVVGVVDSDSAPVDRLRQAILQLVDFLIDHDAFLTRLFMAALADESSARNFLGSLAGRHPRLLVRLIAAAQTDGSLVEEDPLQVLCFLMASVGLPRLLAAGWQGPPLFGRSLSAALGRIARNRAKIVQRLDWAIRGLSPQGSK